MSEEDRTQDETDTFALVIEDTATRVAALLNIMVEPLPSDTAIDDELEDLIGCIGDDPHLDSRAAQFFKNTLVARLIVQQLGIKLEQWATTK